MKRVTALTIPEQSVPPSLGYMDSIKNIDHLWLVFGISLGNGIGVA